MVQLPIGREDGFTGVVDLVRMRALAWADDSGVFVQESIPEHLVAEAVRRRAELDELVAERHPAALEEYVVRSELSANTLVEALRELTRSGEVVVVLCGAAYGDRGVEPLLDAVVDYLPAPLDRPAVCDVGDPTRRRSATVGVALTAGVAAMPGGLPGSRRCGPCGGGIRN